MTRDDHPPELILLVQHLLGGRQGCERWEGGVESGGGRGHEVRWGSVRRGINHEVVVVVRLVHGGGLLGGKEGRGRGGRGGGVGRRFRGTSLRGRHRARRRRGRGRVRTRDGRSFEGEEGVLGG